uniref:TERF1-interacting nuclear factor 2 N-terminal domain-containing protein n=1 Tax=Oncorhynchus kisutch TaxID=8019 RepID=A0A8C7M7M5_ONCKI
MVKTYFVMADGPLPLSSLRLFVPPLRLASAALWQVVQRRDIMDYGLVEEFVTTVLEVVPDLMSYRERVQLIMGLRAQNLFLTDLPS